MCVPRSGIGKLTLVDADDLCVSNTNRQLPALDGQYGRAKIEAMGWDKLIRPLGEGSFEWAPEFVSEQSLGYRNGDILVVHNFGHEPITLPTGELIASSLHGMTAGHGLVADQTVWLRIS